MDYVYNGRFVFSFFFGGRTLKSISALSCSFALFSNLFEFGRV